MSETEDQQLLRYSRQILLPEVGSEGQQRLASSHALIIGLGGLGSPAAMYLAAAGVGRLTLCDFDQVDLSNLQRQILHGTADLGRAKTDSAADTLHALNPEIQLLTLSERLDAHGLAQAVAVADVVLDCSDNFATRFAINQACVAARKPLVAAAAIGMQGQLMVFRADRAASPCYHCLFGDEEEETATCSESGVLAPVVGVMGSLQAVEALKVLLGLSDPAVTLTTYDGLRNHWHQTRIQSDPHCPTCGSA
jgi:molybdopterin/thiamine biosynthesis adenylyltransferase